MRLVVLGANGLLGSNVVVTAAERDHEVVATYHSTKPDLPASLERLDITDTGLVESVLAQASPDAVVNCAAMTDVDGCEDDTDRAFAVNAEAPGAIARYCAANGIRFGHVSTDYVFDGRGGEPYAESDEPNPIQEYGRSKLAGERAVTEAMADPLVARLSFVWGIHRSSDELEGFPRWVRDSVREAGETPVFTDQRVTPTRAGQAATALLDLLEADASGTLHVASRSCVTPYEFGAEIHTRMADPAGTLAESSMDDLDRAAERPADTCLAVDCVESVRGQPQPTLAADLDAVADYI